MNLKDICHDLCISLEDEGIFIKFIVPIILFMETESIVAIFTTNFGV